MNHGIRPEDQRVAGQLHPPAEIGVLQAPQPVVETTGLFEDGTRDSEVAATCMRQREAER